ncbi:heat shock factor protein 5 isoform 1-T2 [Clarias gariepinus]
MEITSAQFTFQLNPNNFPSKLWHLVNDPQLYSICWDDRGEKILIHEERFEVEVLFSHDGQIKRYFNTRDFNSFVRQLNLYGFRKVRRYLDGLEEETDRAVFTSQMHRFHNPNFKRDKPELLVNLKRLRPVKYPRLPVSTEASDMIPRHFHYPMMNSPQENLHEGSVFSLKHQETPYHHYTNDSQRVRECDRTPNPCQVFVMGRGDSGVVFPHIPMDSPSAYPFSTMYMQQSSRSTVPAGNSTAVIPHHSDYRLYTPVYQWYSPESFDINMPCCQQPAPSYVHWRYYTDYPGSYPYWTNSNCQAGDAPEAKDSGVNLDMVFKIADEMQAVSFCNPFTNEKQSPEKEETPLTCNVCMLPIF